MTLIRYQMDLTDFYRAFHPNTKVYIGSSASHRTFLITDHILSHKTCLNIYKKIEIAPCILSNHHGLKLDFNSNRNKRRPTRVPLLCSSRL